MKNKSARGFTLIELLIVIALLGALAVGLLATIDPFEQLKKGRDTSTRNTTSEFYNANLRYYSTKAEFPWGTGGLGTATPVNNLGSSVTALVNAGELKNRFMELAGTGNLSKIYVSSTSSEHMAVCYMPESKGFKVDRNAIYTIGGGTQAPSYCKGDSPAGTNDCYFCVQ